MNSHAAKLNKSERLRKLDALLCDGYYHSTKEILEKTGSVAVHSDIHELRCNGRNISPALYLGKTLEGRKMYAYRRLACA
jgi:hypothetical protein